MSIARDNGGKFSPVLGGTSNVNTSGFTFDSSLDFLSQEQWTLPTNEKQSRAFSWTPADLSSSSHEYNIPSSSPIHLFHTLQAHRHHGACDIKTRRKGITLAVVFETIHTLLFHGKVTLRSTKLFWSSLSPHLPPSPKRSRRTTESKWYHTGMRAVFRRPGRIAEGSVGTQSI